MIVDYVITQNEDALHIRSMHAYTYHTVHNHIRAAFTFHYGGWDMGVRGMGDVDGDG